MFQFAGFARSCLYIQQVVHLGFPISDTLGSMLVSNSPRHFVGHHVLLRLCVPRYPPLALCSLTILVRYFYLTFSVLYLIDLCLLLSSEVSIPLHLSATRGLTFLLALSQTKSTFLSFDSKLFLLLLDIMQFSRFASGLIKVQHPRTTFFVVTTVLNFCLSLIFSVNFFLFLWR
jgi:hypothetical protein